MAEPSIDPSFELRAARDPAPLIHRLRREDPVHFVPGVGFRFVPQQDDEIVTPGSRVREDLQKFEPLGLGRRASNLPVAIAR